MLAEVEIHQIIAISQKAGAEILKVYNDPETSRVVDYKSDASPLTLADRISHKTIKESLQKQFPHIPILSEEDDDIPYEKRKHWDYFWLVDPLDGTKEFIKRNGEFTVNIALINKNRPVLGVIFAPVKDVVYYGLVNDKAYKQVAKNQSFSIKVNDKKNDLTAVRSRSHSSEEEELILNAYDIKDSLSVGSSLKFCMVAEGKADIYYRHGPTMEWDTAAGQAIIEAASGRVLAQDSPLKYNKAVLSNSNFLCLGF